MSEISDSMVIRLSGQGSSQSFGQDRFSEVAAYLHQVRITQGLSITDVAQRSSLAPFLIQTIERGDFQSLPETLPSGVCIQRYADALGLKGAEVASGLSRRASAR